MARKQHQKSQQTRSELKEAALRLIRERGYNDTSVADIVNLAEYSVGAFYGHFKSKQDLVREIWGEYVVGEINKSVREGTELINDFEGLVDYLLSRGQEISNDRCFRELQQPFVFTPENTGAMRAAAQDYTEMLRRALRFRCPEADDFVLSITASIMHCVFNAFAEQKYKEPRFGFTRENLRFSMLMLADMCARGEYPEEPQNLIH